MLKTTWLQHMQTAITTLSIPLCTALLTAPFTATPAVSAQAKQQPNIVVIFGDNIGMSNISAYSLGLMGYKTPNIDRIAKEGMLFTDYYAEQSSTAGRSAFITGQTPYRTGLTKVGLPGTDIGLQPEDVTLATVLKSRGYNTAQFGKNHLGDLDKFLPTNHGFDEFYGNLYAQNAGEDLEHPDYPDDPEFLKKYGPRGVIHSFADGKITDTGPLDSKRLQIFGDDIANRASKYLEQQKDSGKPLFMWVNFNHMHHATHVKPESVGQSGKFMGSYADGMIDHDKNVGTILDKLDELGMAKNTIVLYTTDNGPQANTWPDAGITPFRGEMDTNWEGAYRVPAVIRWPEHIPAGSLNNGIVASLDWFPTFVAAAGDPNIKEELLKGYKIGRKKYKVHLDGYDILPYLTGKEEISPRKGFFYFSDDGDILAVRANNFKFVFMEQRTSGTFAIWTDPFTPLRIPKLFNLRLDPFERADTSSNTYYDWLFSHVFLISFAQDIVAEHAATYVDFPPRQKAASFTIEQAGEMLKENNYK